MKGIAAAICDIFTSVVCWQLCMTFTFGTGSDEWTYIPGNMTGAVKKNILSAKSPRNDHLLLNSTVLVAYEALPFSISCSYSKYDGDFDLQWHIYQPYHVVLPTAQGATSWGRFSVLRVNRTTIKLRINFVHKFDAGVYTCAALTEKGIYEKQITLAVRRRRTGGCSDSQFQCRTSGLCIFLRFRCDGFSDCHDGSDEDGCDGDCGEDFRCDSGECVSMNGLCDKRVSPGQSYRCRDRSDEKFCSSVNATVSRDLLTPKPWYNHVTYVVVAAVITFASTFAIMVLAQHRIRLRHRALIGSYQRRARLQQQLRERNQPRSSSAHRSDTIFIPPRRTPASTNLSSDLPTTDVALSGQIIMPPSYSEVAGRDSPPPPYSTLEHKTAEECSVSLPTEATAAGGESPVADGQRAESNGLLNKTDE